ncbi:unnamed protein product, partial [Rotaria socialis]
YHAAVRNDFALLSDQQQQPQQLQSQQQQTILIEPSQ